MKMSDKERLENIIAVDGQGNVLIKGEDFHWLLEQAKRVELLERENKALNDMLTTLEKQDITKLLNQNVRLIKQNKRYREALEHIERIQSVDVAQQIARQALEG